MFAATPRPRSVTESKGRVAISFGSVRFDWFGVGFSVLLFRKLVGGCFVVRWARGVSLGIGGEL